MKPSDFKQIVKDSIREAFYTPERCLDSPLKNADVPENGCWWMRPNLTFFTALRDGMTDHEMAALIELGRPHPSYPYRELIKKGYVRIVVKNDEKILFFNPPITRPQLQRLMDISIEQNKTLIYDDGRNEKILRARELRVDESLLLEELFGKKMEISYLGNYYQAVLSKNTKPGELPYRISWFGSVGNEQLHAKGHIHITEKEALYIQKYEKLPPKFYERFNGFTSQTFNIQQIYENLLLLEESSRELDLWLENKTSINESMTVMVKDGNYSDDLSQLTGVCNKLMSGVLSPFLQKLPQDQQNYFRKNGVGFYETIVPDGSYFDPHPHGPGGYGGIGIINVYLSGFTSDSMREITRQIFDNLRKWNIKWKTPKIDQSGMYKISKVLRIPVVNNPNKSEVAPEMQLSNINSYQIFHNLLQFEGEHNFSMTAKELIERIVTVLKHDPEWIKQNVIRPSDSNWPKAERDDQEIDNPHIDIMKKFGDEMSGARMISGGLDEDRIIERLHQLITLARWAIQHGYSEIDVG